MKTVRTYMRDEGRFDRIVKAVFLALAIGFLVFMLCMYP